MVFVNSVFNRLFQWPHFESGVFFPPNHLSFPASLRANALRTQQKINKTITTVIK